MSVAHSDHKTDFKAAVCRDMLCISDYGGGCEGWAHSGGRHGLR